MIPPDGAPGFLSGLSEDDQYVAPEITSARDVTLKAIEELSRNGKRRIDKIGERAGLTKGHDGKWRDRSMSAAA